MKRLCIYPKDIAALTGVSVRTASNKLKALKKVLNKEKYQYVTIEEFCAHYGFDPNVVAVEFYGK